MEGNSSVASWFDRFKAEYPRRSGSQEWQVARQRFVRHVKDRVPPEAIVDGAARYRRWCEATEKSGTEFVKQAATFLSRRGWEEAYGPPTPEPPRKAGDRAAEALAAHGVGVER